MLFQRRAARGIDPESRHGSKDTSLQTGNSRKRATTLDMIKLWRTGWLKDVPSPDVAFIRDTVEQETIFEENNVDNGE